MSPRGNRRWKGHGASGARATLLAATFLTAAPALAQELSVEDRLDRLEALVEGLIAKFDAQAGEAEARNAAMDAQSREMRAQAQTVLQATRALEERQVQMSAAQTTISRQQAEMSAKIIDFEIPSGEGFTVGNTRVTYDGYVKLDAISQRTSGGQLPGNSILRDFLIPVAIPVGGNPSGFDTDFSARQTR
ncbi:MAG: hypothetical protein V2I74_03395, partial [Erythrobacter sp.]|nr:hypothetical protein [Erythrobacter sp.]